VNILIKNIKGLVQVRESTPACVAGKAMSELPAMENAYLVVKGDLIESFGSMDQMPSIAADQVIDASDRFILPAFIDSHTHLVFATTRAEEFVMKMKGAS
jgi:imidazolonepropionase